MKTKHVHTGILFLVIFSICCLPAAAATLSIKTTDLSGVADSDFTIGSAFYVLVDIDNASGLAGAALTIEYDKTALAVDAGTGEIDAAAVESDIFNIFYDNRTPPGTPEQAYPRVGNNDVSSTGKLMLSGAYVNPSNGGGASAGAATLFKIKFKVTAGAVANTTYTLTLKKTELFNPDAGWFVDSNGNNQYDAGVDPTTPVQVDPLVGAVDNTSPSWGGDLSDDFPLISAVFSPSTANVTALPLTGDSDGDGMRDDWEMQYFGDLDTSDGTGDYDQDGYTDLQEFINADNGETDSNQHTYDPTFKNAPDGTGYNAATMILPGDFDGNGDVSLEDVRNIFLIFVGNQSAANPQQFAAANCYDDGDGNTTISLNDVRGAFRMFAGAGL